MHHLKLQILKHQSSKSPPTQSQPAKIHLPPLNLAAPEIRLLTLFPAEDKASEIFITLTTVSLLAKPTYEALSYTWGEETRRSHINLDGQKFPVTKNLEAALRHLRRRSEIRTLWADAACIDQNNIAERNHQVQQMRAIYSQASQVLIWLGEAGNHTDEVMDYIAGFDTFLAYPRWAESPLSPIQLEAMHDIFTRPWWSRMWVLQELLVAVHKPLVGCGEKWITWDNISFLGWALFTYHMKGEFDGLYRQNWTWFMDAALLRISWKRKEGEGLPLEDLLGHTETRFATDPRDHVLAVLGLADKETQQTLLPNYEESVSHIYQKATFLCIQHSGQLLYLLKALRSNRRDLPSWCPDFSKDWGVDEDSGRRYALPIRAAAAAPSKNDIQSNIPECTNSSIKLPTHMNQVIEDLLGRMAENSEGENEQLGSSASRDGASGRIKCSHPVHDPATSTLTVSGVLVGTLNHVIKSKCTDKALEGHKSLLWALRSVEQEKLHAISQNGVVFLKEVQRFRKFAWIALVGRLGMAEAAASFAKGSFWMTLLQGRGDDEFRNLFPNFNADGKAEFYTRVESALRTMSKTSGSIEPDLYPIFYFLSLSMVDCSYLITDSGYFGRATNIIKEGDILCILFGCLVPLVLRPYGSRTYKVIDFAWANDLMNGEYVQDEDNLKIQTFDLR